MPLKLTSPLSDTPTRSYAKSTEKPAQGLPLSLRVSRVCRKNPALNFEFDAQTVGFIGLDKLKTDHRQTRVSPWMLGGVDRIR